MEKIPKYGIFQFDEQVVQTESSVSWIVIRCMAPVVVEAKVVVVTGYEASLHGPEKFHLYLDQAKCYSQAYNTDERMVGARKMTLRLHGQQLDQQVLEARSGR